MAGTFNPLDDTGTTSTRPAHTLNAAGVRKWFSDELNSRPHDQDFNLVFANFYSAGDYYSIGDTEGNDNYLRSMLQTIVDNDEWTVSGSTGTADISAKRGLKGRITNAAAAGISSFGSVVQSKVAIMYSETTSQPIRIVPSSTIQTPNGYSLYLATGDGILVIGNNDGTKYRVYPLVYGQYNWGYPLVHNGDFEYWPENTTFTPSASTNTFFCAGWKGRRQTNTNWTVSRQTGFSGARYCMRIQRTAGDTATTALNWTYQIPSHLAQFMAGKTVWISFNLRCGTTMVTALGAGASITTEYRAGTGVDESPSLTTGAFPTAIAGSSGGSFSGGYTPSTTATRVFCNPFVCDSTQTEAAFRMAFTPISTAAGASEYLEITNFKIEIANQPTPFIPEPAGSAKSRLLGRYRKTFLKDTAPAQNVGAGTGELRVACTKAGANAQFFQHVEFEVEMESTPTVTLYNPAAANGQVRNITGSTDSTGAAAANVTTKGFDITMTGNAAWAVGDTLAVHYVADARL